MSNAKIKCYVLPSEPLPMLLPAECVAEVVKKPTIEPLKKAPASWMKGHVNWQNQRLPLMSFSSLLDSDHEESGDSKTTLIVLNAIPGAARKAYSGLLCSGKVTTVSIDDKVAYSDEYSDLDKRYVETVIRAGKKDYIIPKLTSLAVAFTYLS